MYSMFHKASLRREGGGELNILGFWGRALVFVYDDGLVIDYVFHLEGCLVEV